MDKLKALLDRCKCGVYLTVNQHRDYYDTAEQAAREMIERGDEIGPEELAEIISRDTLIELQFYPNTPVGFWKIIHYDLDSALDEALEAVGAPQPRVDNRNDA